MSSDTILSLEKKIFAVAVLFTMSMMGLIGFAAYRYGITVPGCVTDVKPFTAGSLSKKAEGHYELHAVARMWAFDPALIEVPTGSTVDVFVSSVDVNHGFHIDGTDVNLMAVPGAIAYAQVTFKHPGEYHVLCHEYCGVGHQNMYAVLKVVDGLKDARVGSAEAAPAPAAQGAVVAGVDSTLVAKGKALYTEKGCLACHSLTGARMVGPSFKGLYGSSVKLEGGTTVKADDAYIMESIREPSKKVVEGYPNAMPPLPMTEDEAKALTEFIKSVR